MRPANRIVTECPMLRARMQEMLLPMSVFLYQPAETLTLFGLYDHGVI